MNSLKRLYNFYLDDILTSMLRITEYIEGKEFNDFKKNRLVVDAVVRNFEIIGEASKNIPENIQKKYPDIPWKKMYGLRNLISHKYFGIDYEMLWEIASVNLPQNIKNLQQIIKEEKNTSNNNFNIKGGHIMTEKLMTNYVDHICIAVNDVKKAEKDYIDAFGWDVAYRYVDEPEKIRVTGFMVGPTAIEIMEDTDGSGEVAKFIKRSGEGVMLISYNVDNCEESLNLLKKNKVKLIDQKPRWFAEYKRNFAFIHPAATHGVLTEIIDGKY